MSFLLNSYRYAVAGGGGPGFLTMTIAHGMFPSTQTDIEIWFSFTNSDLKTVANGGHVVNSNHRRIASDSAGTTILKYDIVTPDATTDSTGLIEGFFLLASGSSSVDTVVYLAYNDNGITSYQGDRANVWARKAFVNHGSRDGSTIDLTDETGNGNGLTNNNGVTVTAGKIGSAASFASASSRSLSKSGFSPAPTSAMTISAWIKPNTVSDNVALATAHSFTSRFVGFEIDVVSGKARLIFTQGGDNFKVVAGSTTIPTDGTWHWAVGTYDGAHMNIYVDGVSDATPVAVTGDVQVGEDQFAIGRRGGIGESYWDGAINAPRVDVSHADSADRILAQYRNQNAPATYITVT